MSYGEDLAYIHDAGYGDFARQAAPGLLKILAESGTDHGLVVDLGCGSGIWAARLIDAGYEVLGIDQSAAMISLADKRVPAARFEVGSIYRVEIPRCIAVTSIGECLGYLATPDQAERDLEGLFLRVCEALRPGGVFVFDIMTTSYEVTSGGSSSHDQGRDWTVQIELELLDDHLLRRAITTSRRVGERSRRSQEEHFVRLVEPDPVVGSLKSFGFGVQTLQRYGDFELPPGRTVFLARKPD